MKNFMMRCLGICLLVSLAACGGGSISTYTLGGSINGLQIPNVAGSNATGNGVGLQISDGYESMTIPSTATSFTFPTKLAQNSSYSVSVTSQPAIAANPNATPPTPIINLYCTVGSGSGVLSTSDVTTVQINCQQLFTIGGTITGLTGGTLTLISGTDQVTVQPGATTFVLPTQVLSGTAYTVTTLTLLDSSGQPIAGQTTQTCTVTNGVGIVGTSSAGVTNISVSCQ